MATTQRYFETWRDFLGSISHCKNNDRAASIKSLNFSREIHNPVHLIQIGGNTYKNTVDGLVKNAIYSFDHDIEKHIGINSEIADTPVIILTTNGFGNFVVTINVKVVQ